VRKLLICSIAVASSACDARGPDGALWTTLQSLAAPEGLTPPVDRSNARALDPITQELGHKMYFDPDFSGNATLVDTLGRTVTSPPGRAVKGVRINASCATCHDPARGGTDHSSLAGVSIGAGAYDVSSQPSVNSAFNELWYWNGRNDSLWAQIIAVTESGVSMGGNRLRVMWRIAEAYRAEFEPMFGALPVTVSLARQKARLLVPTSTVGACALDANQMCPEGCVSETMPAMGCFLRFPLEGRPGREAGCQRGSRTEPFGDAYDCMAAADKDAVTKVYVGFAKAVAAYETSLISDDSPFDRWVAERVAGKEDSGILSDSAQRGAELFAGRASCVECHSGPLLTDNQFHDIGIPQNGDFIPTEDACVAGLAACDCVAGTSCLPWGLHDGLGKLQKNGFRRDSKWSDDSTDDSRAHFYRMDLTTDAGIALRGKWKTPGLRDVAITAPYMHTGGYRTLREVVEHYNWGGHGSRYAVDAKVVPLGLSDHDLDDLTAFLESLTGDAMPLEQVTAPPLPASSVF